MKKLGIYFLFAIVAASSCSKKSDSAFSESPDQRLNETLSADQATLVKAPYGWRGLIYPKGLTGGVVGFYFKFNDSNRVEMFSDFDSASAVTPMTASYRLKALQQPSLVFDTYSYVHVLADPNGSVNGGSYGSGLSSDFEFAIDSIGGDTVHLTGRFNGTKAVLIKATQQEANSYYSKQFSNRLFLNISKYLTYFKRLVVGGHQYEVLVDQVGRTITFTWVDDSGNVHKATVGYYFTTNGVAFSPAFTDGSIIISGFSNITWNAGTTTLSFTINGNAAGIVGSGTPIQPDLDAPHRWWQFAVDKGLWWISEKGFHVNGVDDAYGITKTTSFFYLMYRPKYSTYNGSPYDVAGPIQLLPDNSLNQDYALAYRTPNFTTDGRLTFPYLGQLGNIPASDSVAMAKTRIQFSDSYGYYLVQTSDISYDMVSARDGKAWVTWIWPF